MCPFGDSVVLGNKIIVKSSSCSQYRAGVVERQVMGQIPKTLLKTLQSGFSVPYTHSHRTIRKTLTTPHTETQQGFWVDKIFAC